jgi:hypothetical protein
MATGIEIAALVLAGIRTAIVVGKTYPSAAKFLNIWGHYRSHVLAFNRALGASCAVYEIHIEELLDPIVQSQSRIDVLLRDPGGSEWEKPELAEKLEMRLSKSYEPYMTTIKGMNDTVAELKAKMGIVDGKVISFLKITK